MVMASLFRKQRGFLMIELFVFIAILGVLGAIKARSELWSTYDALAVATGAYMKTVRGAVINGLGTYEAALGLVDTSKAPTGLYPTPPAWAVFTGEEQTVQVRDLKQSGLLPSDFPERSPLGRSVYVKLLRPAGTCPGIGCEVRGFVVTCWPVSTPLQRTAFDSTTCPAAPANLDYSERLIDGVVRSADGFGGRNVMDPTRVRGTLMDVSETVLGIPAGSGGHVVLAASLNATSFNQFVRQGDTRAIFLNNTLDVAGSISTDTGLLLNTKVENGQACDRDGMYATSLFGDLAQCRGTTWFVLTSYVVTSMQTLADGAAVPAPLCPGGNVEPFTYASLEKTDVTMTGSDINVRGTQNGTVNGSGAVSQSGVVSVSGTYAGTLQSSPDSTIRVSQGVDVSSGSVVMTPANANARALVVSGCRTNG
jgi:type II secretory pathway pseudopilin PulG